MTQSTNKPQTAPEPEQEETAAPLSIAKPGEFDLSKFRSKRAPTIAGVATLQTALPVHRLSETKDFARTHPDDTNYWSVELCFVRVPTPGQRRDTLHLIDEDLAMKYLESADIIRCRLALAAKPDGSFFLCIVPSQNLDNTWNVDNLQGCEAAMARMQMDEIDRNVNLSRDGKNRERSKIAAHAIADFKASKTLARARETVELAVAKYKLEQHVSPEIAHDSEAALKAMNEVERAWQRATDKIAERASLSKTPGSDEKSLH